jgi:hypothetical protein
VDFRPRCKKRTIFQKARLKPSFEPLAPNYWEGHHVDSIQMREHLRRDRYGNFRLTDAIRPALARRVIPRQGFRIDTYRDDKAGFSVPVLAAAVSREKLFDVFLEMIEPLGEVVDVVLETSHDSKDSRHIDYCREQIDMPVLKSHCCDFEELLCHDGCTGMAVLASAEPLELQFDEHKLLVVYAADLKPFSAILQEYGIERDDTLKLISEGEHLHNSEPRYRAQFDQLAYRLGVEQGVERMVSGEW